MLASPSKPHEPSTATQRRRKQYVLFIRLSVALMASLWVWKASLRYGLGSSSDQPYETESLKRQVIRTSFGWGGAGMLFVPDGEDAGMNSEAVAMTEKLRAILLGGSSEGDRMVEADERERREQREAEEKEVAAQSEGEKKCRELIEAHQVVPGRSWGTMQRSQKDEWVSLTCDRYFCQPHKMAGKGSYDCVPLAVSRAKRGLRQQER